MCASPSLSLSEVLTAVWFLFGPAAVSRTRDGASSVDVRGAWPVFVFCVFSVLHVKVFSLRVLHSSSCMPTLPDRQFDARSRESSRHFKHAPRTLVVSIVFPLDAIPNATQCHIGNILLIWEDDLGSSFLD